jgi:phosphate transport system substrate-binding protein
MTYVTRLTELAILILGVSLQVNAVHAQEPPEVLPPLKQLFGSGATTPNPLYQRWISEYEKLKPSYSISYQSVGSGAGIKQFQIETVDFGATDSALTPEEISKSPVKRGRPIQIPLTGSLIGFTYNLPGVDNLRLSRKAYCGIVDGSIKNWNDRRITQDNPSLKSSKKSITFVHRSDGSMVTSLFTQHLVKACPNWKSGSGKSVEWLTGKGAKGEEGMSAQVRETEGAIGYIPLSWAKSDGVKLATLQNRSGKFIVPSSQSAGQAFSTISNSKDLTRLVPDPTAEKAYPIVGLTWMLFYEKYQDKGKASALKNFLKWSLKDGQSYADELGYLVLPPSLVKIVTLEIDGIRP